MGHTTVKSEEIRNMASDSARIYSNVRQIAKSVMAVQNNLMFEVESTEKIRRCLSDLHNQILNEAVKLNSMSEALQKVAELYEKNEHNLCDRDINESVLSTTREKEKSFWENIREKVRNWLVEHGLISPEQQERVAGEAVTIQQEKEQDLYLQKEIEKIKQKNIYSKKNWEKASSEQRKEILNSYIAEIAAIMGLNMGSIEWFSAESENGYITLGSYSDSDKKVHINEWVINNLKGADSYQLFSTVVHEMRHAYQDAVRNNPEEFVVTEETMKKWAESFENYKSTEDFMKEGMSTEEAFEAYRNQEVEIDARKFAKQD